MFGFTQSEAKPWERGSMQPPLVLLLVISTPQGALRGPRISYM